MTQPPTHITRQPYRRHKRRIDVRLLWCQNDDQVTMAVTDTKTGETFEVPYVKASARSRCSATPTRTRHGQQDMCVPIAVSHSS